MGLLRFSFVITVMYFHLVQPILAGQLAVRGFFVLSGYVITLVSSEIYHNGWRGKYYFLVNRIARIWPTYLVCLLASLGCIYATGFTAEHYKDALSLPDSPYGWLVQFSIIGQSGFHMPFPQRLLPSAWSLSTELVYYLIIGLVTGKSKFLTTAGFSLSIAMTIMMWLCHLPGDLIYLTVYGPAAVFFTGGMFYHYRAYFKKLRLTNSWLLVGLANALLYAPEHVINSIPLIYVVVGCLGYIIMCLQLASLDRKPSRFDQFLADVTYPMFLLHWPIAAVLCYYVFGHYHFGFDVFASALLASLAAGSFIVFAVEIPCKKLRSYFRQRAMR